VGQQGVESTLPALVTAQECYAMTAEGYDYEYALTTSIHDEWGYGSYSSTTGTFAIEVTVDPPPWICGSCRQRPAIHAPLACFCCAKSTDKIKGQVDEHTPGPRHDRPRVG